MWLLTFIFISAGFAASDSKCEDQALLSRATKLMMPKCIRDAELPVANTPEERVRQAIEGEDIKLTLTRLVFSETLAGQCSQNDALVAAKGIAWVLANRMRDPQKRFGSGKNVVTQFKQFRSSFGDYDVAKRRELLCPESAGPGWETLWKASVEAVEVALNSKENPLPGVHNYYLLNHFKGSKLEAKYHGKMPAWGSAENQVLHPGISRDSNCIRFYRVN